MYTLIQRLRLDDTIGFNYEYMGYAEYEQGDTARTRAFLAGKPLIRYQGTLRSQPVTYFFANPRNRADVGQIQKTVEAMEAGQFQNKGHLGSFQLSPGYLMLSPMPMLIVERQFEDRVDQFLGSVKEQIVKAGYDNIQAYLDESSPVYGAV